MRCSPENRGLAAFVALLATLLLAAPAAADDPCAVCHATQREARLRDPAIEARGSVHGADAVGCAGCHGGRRTEPTVRAHDREAGFDPRPRGAAVIERCGGCHADVRFIRRQGADLQTDQLALFRIDAHGRALAAGRGAAATCVSCHGAHAIRSASDPTSTTHATRVVATCSTCHSDPQRLAGARLPTDQERRWRESVHGRALLERGNQRAPSCDGCHGSHGEFAESGGAAGSCRRCHPEEAARFDRSPHAAAYLRLGFSGCAACHGAHDVREASAASLGSDAAVCNRCHAEGQRAFDLARRISARKTAALLALDRAEAAVRRARRSGFSLPNADALIEEASTARVRLDIAMHTLDEPSINEAARGITEPSAAAERIARQALGLRVQHRRGWLVALPLLGLLFLFLMLKIREVDRRGGAG